MVLVTTWSFDLNFFLTIVVFKYILSLSFHKENLEKGEHDIMRQYIIKVLIITFIIFFIFEKVVY